MQIWLGERLQQSDSANVSQNILAGTGEFEETLLELILEERGKLLTLIS